MARSWGWECGEQGTGALRSTREDERSTWRAKIRFPLRDTSRVRWENRTRVARQEASKPSRSRRGTTEQENTTATKTKEGQVRPQVPKGGQRAVGPRSPSQTNGLTIIHQNV